MRPQRRPPFLLVLTILLAHSITAVIAADQAELMKVMVSIPPQAYFVEKIGGDYVDVDIMLGPGQSPATYEPTPMQMTNLARTQLYFRVGVPFEKQLVEAIAGTFAQLRVVNLRESIKRDRSLTSKNQRDETDPHFWLDPNLMQSVAVTICDELIRADSVHADRYRDNLFLLQEELRQLDSSIAAVLAPFAGREIVVFHPAYGYFAAAYGLKQVAIEYEGKEPAARRLVEVIEKARTAGTKVIFVQPQFATTSAQTVAAAIDAQLVPLDPLARDFADNLRKMAEQIRATLAVSE